MRSMRCHSTRDILLAAGVFSLLSLYITYQLGAPLVDRGITTGSQTWLTIQPEQDQLRRGILSQLSGRDKISDSNRRKGLPSRLEKKLLQLEESILQASKSPQKLVVVRGQKGIIQRDFPVYKKTFSKHGLYVQPPLDKNGSLNGLEDDIFGKDRLLPKDWTLLLCMSFTDGDSGNCLEKSSYSHLHPHQKVNRIPGIRNTLWRRDGFCFTMATARQLSSARRSHITPLCFVLPNQVEQFIHVADALGEDVQWVIKPLTPGGTMEYVESLETYGKARLKEHSIQRPLLVQQYFPHPFLVFGTPVSLRVYVLVTSVAPLRAFLYNEGIVHFRQSHSKGFRKMLSRTWLLSQLWHYVARNYGQQAVRTALLNIQSVLIQTLLIAETMIAAHFSSSTDSEKKYRCQNCFQLLGFDLILNASFHPVVLEVNGQPNLQETSREDGWAANGVKRSLVDSLFGLLYGSTSVGHEVADSLEECADNTGVMGLNCHISHDLCLTENDLIFLMDSRRENLNRGGFKQLYPGLGSEHYSALIHDLEYFVTLPRDPSITGANAIREASRHNTADLHGLLTSTERCYNRHLADEDYSDSGLEDSALWNGFNISVAFRTPDNVNYKPNTQDLLSRPPCSEDPITMPYLLNIFSEPLLNLTPPFSPVVVEYTANVPYDRLMVTIWAYAQNCQSEARLDDKFGPSQPANYTLGLGDNRLTFIVVDIRHTEPWVINSYSVVVHRVAPVESEPPFDPSQPHEVCALKQECELRVVPNDPCGIQRDLIVKNWTEYDAIYGSLPVCEHGDAPGRWLLPCTSCSGKSSCFWREAFWAPFGCQHPFVTQPTLAECLAGKKLLFIGDSTNRGIMHYLMERLNGTLAEWDKTHHIRVHTNLNGGRTAISFAYYPQFWLPTNERPVFDKALFQLLQRSRPLENNSNTILIVGGVHWLATQHLHMLMQALRRDGLQGIRLVMKTLGSGFHLPVDGVHCLSQAEQRKLLLHSRGLSEFAKHYHFDIIDTFHITIPRFRDFLQGKCACHFHRVVPIASDPSSREYRYHVEGPVNAVYSEILISRLCAKHQSNVT